MDEKISLELISRYSEAYTEKVLKGFFASTVYNKLTFL
jgi:hypothetical protein